MSLATRLLLACYPRAWRRRYGPELADLIGAERLTPRVAADVVLAGLRQRAHAARLATSGGFVMTIGPAWRHPTAFALFGALLLLPTFAFVGTSVLAYQLGIDPIRALAEPVQQTLQNMRPIDLALVAAPPLAFIAALAPLVRVGVDRRDGGLEAVIAIRARALNVVIGLLALALAGMLVWHIVFESVMEAGA
jgi:hypothetical protein